MNETKRQLEDTKSYIVELAPRVQTDKLTFPIGKLQTLQIITGAVLRLVWPFDGTVYCTKL